MMERNATHETHTRCMADLNSFVPSLPQSVLTGLNLVAEENLLGHRQTNTAASQAGSFVQMEKTGHKCDHCTSTMQSKDRQATGADLAIWQRSLLWV